MPVWFKVAASKAIGSFMGPREIQDLKVQLARKVLLDPKVHAAHKVIKEIGRA